MEYNLFVQSFRIFNEFQHYAKKCLLEKVMNLYDHINSWFKKNILFNYLYANFHRSRPKLTISYCMWRAKAREGASHEACDFWLPENRIPTEKKLGLKWDKLCYSVCLKHNELVIPEFRGFRRLSRNRSNLRVSSVDSEQSGECCLPYANAFLSPAES